jgi:hypothetical protein
MDALRAALAAFLALYPIEAHPGPAAMPGLSIRRSGDQLHNSLAGGNSGQIGMDDVLLPAPPLDADAAPDPAVDP